MLFAAFVGFDDEELRLLLQSRRGRVSRQGSAERRRRCSYPLAAVAAEVSAVSSSPRDSGIVQLCPAPTIAAVRLRGIRPSFR